MSDSLANGRKFRVLNVLDDFSRECLAIEVNTSLPGSVVTRVLDGIAVQRGYPEVIVVDNGPEFRGREMDTWACQHGVRLQFIDPGKPMQNAFVESFKDKLRGECLNSHWFVGIGEARETTVAWRKEYNERRPHRSLGRIPPAEYARRAAALQTLPASSGPLLDQREASSELIEVVTLTPDQ